METINLTWSLIDNLYYLCSRLEYVNAQENIFRVRLIRYRGQSLQLSDGIIINADDWLLKIHLHNCQLMREMQGLQGQVKRALYVYERVQASLPGLAEFIDNHPCKDRIKGILGITLLHRGVKRLGFDSIDIPNQAYLKLKQMYLVPMFLFLHSGPATGQKDKLKPKFLAMSKEKLIATYIN